MANDEGYLLDDLPRELQAIIRQNCTPIPGNYFDKYMVSAHNRQIGVSVAYGVICVCGLLANMFVLFLLFAGGKKGATFKAPSTILVLNLVMADILLLLTLPFSISHRLDDRWKFGNAMCKFEEGVKFLNYYGSVFFITAMAVDRYFVVSRRRYLSNKMARKKLGIASVCLWILALVAVIPLLIFAGVDKQGYCSIMFPRGPTFVGNASLLLKAINEIGCIEDYIPVDEIYEADVSDILNSYPNQDSILGSGSLQDYVNFIDNSMGLEYDKSGLALCKHPDIPSLHIWLIWNFVIGFVVPFFLISVSYIRIATTRLPTQNRDHMRSSLTDNGSSPNGKDVKQTTASQSGVKPVNRKAKLLMNVMVPCLIAAFAICWLPYHFFHLLQIRGVAMSNEVSCYVIRDVTFCLAFFNSALNPVLNSFFLYNFKQRLQRSKGWVVGRLKNRSTRGTRENEQSNDSDESNTVFAEMTLMTTSATKEKEKCERQFNSRL